MTPLVNPEFDASQPDWLQPVLGRLRIPSWLGSVLLHAAGAVTLIWVSQAPGCQGDFGGDGGVSFRKVGIEFGAPGDPGEAGGGSPNSATTAAPSTPATMAPFSSEIPVSPLNVLDAPPVPLSFPSLPTVKSISGAAAVPSLPATGLMNEDFLRPSGGRFGAGGGMGSGYRGRGNGGGGGGGASFIGIQEVGTRFVYVIDRSASMASHSAFTAAKQELELSLSQLTETQQFQVIFYNNTPQALQSRNQQTELFWGTDAQRLIVSEQLQSVTPSEGTNHLPALIMALGYKPDVIYLLTDGAAESALKNADFQQLARLNRQGTRIHCVEFGQDRESAIKGNANFLRQLADKNRGQYIYRQITSRRSPTANP